MKTSKTIVNQFPLSSDQKEKMIKEVDRLLDENKRKLLKRAVKAFKESCPHSRLLHNCNANRDYLYCDRNFDGMDEDTMVRCSDKCLYVKTFLSRMKKNCNRV